MKRRLLGYTGGELERQDSPRSPSVGEGEELSRNINLILLRDNKKTLTQKLIEDLLTKV